MNIVKLELDKLNDCLNLIKLAYKDRNKRLGFDENEGHAKITINELTEMYNSGIEMYGYYINNTIIGFISIKQEEIYLKVKDLVVHPDYQKEGIGTKLINFAKELLNNKSILKLGMIYENKELLKWYQKQGFTITNIIEYPNTKVKTAKLEYRKDDEYGL